MADTATWANRRHRAQQGTLDVLNLDWGVPAGRADEIIKETFVAELLQEMAVKLAAAEDRIADLEEQIDAFRAFSEDLENLA